MFSHTHHLFIHSDESIVFMISDLCGQYHIVSRNTVTEFCLLFHKSSYSVTLFTQLRLKLMLNSVSHRRITYYSL